MHACARLRPQAFLRETKAVAAALGGIEALISLLKRCNRRYQVQAGAGRGGVEGARCSGVQHRLAAEWMTPSTPTYL